MLTSLWNRISEILDILMIDPSSALKGGTASSSLRRWRKAEIVYSMYLLLLENGCIELHVKQRKG